MEELIKRLSKEHASVTMQALAIAQQMGQLGTSEEFEGFLQAAMETVLEDFIEEYNNKKTQGNEV